MANLNADAPGRQRTVAARPTMMDVAARAGVSQATVSLILNGSPGARFSEQTRERVMQATADLGYRLAREGRDQLPSNSKREIISFIVDEVAADPWMAMAFEGARQKAHEYGLLVNLSVAPIDAEGLERTLQKLPSESQYGCICGTILTREFQPSPTLFKVPTVLVNCYDAERRLPSVIPGDLAGARTAIEHLIRAGRRRIGYINGEEDIDTTRDRLTGYKQALASHDIAFDPDIVRPGNWEPSAGYNQTLHLMRLPNPPDSIFCANDMMAVGCLDALRELGLTVPGDISVMGYDNREISQFTRPALSTINFPFLEIGMLAVELLVEQHDGTLSGNLQHKVECKLVARSSV